MRTTQVFTRGLTPASDCERGSPERTSASEAAAESRRGPVAFLRDGEAGEPPARPSAREALRPRWGAWVFTYPLPFLGCL